MKIFFSAVLLFLVPAIARSQAIKVVGSSTIWPFVTVVAEKFGRSSPFKVPVVEATGTGGGFKIFCTGDEINIPSIVTASRRVVLSEIRNCAKNKIQIVEFMFGRDGIVLASSKKVMPLSLSEELIFTALSADNGFGKKPKTWAEAAKLVKHETILPDIPIRVYGPPPTSGTRDAFVELIMEKGAKKLSPKFGWDKKTYKRKSKKIREDGAYIEVGENEMLIIRKIIADPGTLVIMGFSFLDSNLDKIQGLTINGVQPSFESIASGIYTAARPLFFYVKKNHLPYIAGLGDFIREFISQKAAGEEGYLVEKGLIPLTKNELKIQFEKLKLLPALTESDL